VRSESKPTRFSLGALGDPNWQTASQARDDLMRKLLVMHRLREAEERLAKRKPSAEPT
jgi:hypothetical protein